MKNLLEKLEDKAKDWLKKLDEQLQQPVVGVITGEVFTNTTDQNVERK